MVTFRAIGGLGNQLFVLAAAMAHGEAFGSSFSIDLRRAAKGVEKGGPHYRGSSLTSFYLNQTPLSSFIAPRIQSFFLDYLASLDQRFSRVFPFDYSAWCHTSEAAGYDAAVFQKRGLKYFRGYFQSYRYLDYLRTDGKKFELTLTNPSAEYLAKKKQIGSDSYTVVHIRRGDYVSSAPNFGLLAPKYYWDALERLSTQVSMKKVIVFSDDRNILHDKKIRGILEKYDGQYLETGNLDPAEVVLLMSGASSFVMANSSFSWWAAALSKSVDVVYPETWFRAEPQPVDLNFPSWTPVKSSWLA